MHTPLRLTPGIVLVTLMLLLTYAVPAVAPDAELAGMPLGMLGLFAGLLAFVGILIWWLFFSRAQWSERIGALVVVVIVMFAARSVAHASIVGAGMGMFFYIGVLPSVSVALVLGALVGSRQQGASRFLTLTVAIVLGFVPWLLVRTSGISNATGPSYHWRWTPTPEELLLATGDDLPPPVAVAPVTPVPAVAPPTVESVPGRPAPPVVVMSEPLTPIGEWPGFRGADRNSVVRGVTIATDWAATPPVELWRRAVGPGWSSFAVQGDFLYTQEQRGDDEMVSCYRVSTGAPVWGHRDAVRFWESNGGAGPRATPTLHGGRVYAFGATGILNALDAATGALVWSQNVQAKTAREIPIWGFASSPLVVGDLVIVAAAGTLAAYDRTTGAHRWTGPSYGGSYSSPHRVTLDGVEQVVLLGGPGAIGVNPADGAVLWEHAWEPGPIVQPGITADGDLLVNAIAATGGIGTRRLKITRVNGTWTLEERWTSNGLKPYFNDYVVHKGHAYGFDGSILSSIDLADGRRKWKGGRFGNGQLILLANQDLLLVLSEEGELALVSATPDGFTELARFPALDGKTWNHPVLVGDTLLVRNGEEMAAFRLPMPGR